MHTFYNRIDKGGHRATPNWRKHKTIDGKVSICGRAITDKFTLFDGTTIQGKKYICKKCFKPI